MPCGIPTSVTTACPPRTWTWRLAHQVFDKAQGELAGPRGLPDCNRVDLVAEQLSDCSCRADAEPEADLWAMQKWVVSLW